MVCQRTKHSTNNVTPTYHTNSRDNTPYDENCPMGIELQANAKTENKA